MDHVVIHQSMPRNKAQKTGTCSTCSSDCRSTARFTVQAQRPSMCPCRDLHNEYCMALRCATTHHALINNRMLEHIHRNTHTHTHTVGRVATANRRWAPGATDLEASRLKTTPPSSGRTPSYDTRATTLIAHRRVETGESRVRSASPLAHAVRTHRRTRTYRSINTFHLRYGAC